MAPVNTKLISGLNESLGTNLPVTVSDAQLKEMISRYLNELIVHNFQKLVQLLYRIDVNEERLKQMLQENTETDAATILTELILERQKQKLKFRQETRPHRKDTDEERW